MKTFTQRLKFKNIAKYLKQHPKSKNIKTLKTKNNNKIFYKKKIKMN